MSKRTSPWRHNLKAGDLVSMKSGHMAIIMKVSGYSAQAWDDEPLPPPRVKVFYCDDSSTGSCSSWRVDRVLNANR
jgi:hypothetical protein